MAGARPGQSRRADARPHDRQILAAMLSTAEKRGPVHCIRYRVRAELSSPDDARHLAGEVTERELARMNAVHPVVAPGKGIAVANHPTLNTMSDCYPWTYRGNPIGVVFHRYYTGAALTVDEHGNLTFTPDGTTCQIKYEYQIMPLAQLRATRLTCVWGIDGKPGTTSERAAKATRTVINVLQSMHDGQLPMGPSSLPMVEVRSIKIGEYDGATIHGYVVLSCYGSLETRIRAAHDQLKDLDLEAVTMDDYRERLIAMRATGNQEVDAEEAKHLDRKYMVWKIPDSLTQPVLELHAKDFFGSLYESCTVTISAAMHKYAWFILTDASMSTQLKAADFEAVLQSKFGYTISLALSKTRRQRIRMNAAARDRMDQDAALRTTGLKEIHIPPKVIQDALMETAFLDMWIDSVHNRLLPRLVNDMMHSIEKRVQELVDERLSAAVDKRLAEFEETTRQKILRTIDSAIDTSLHRALDAQLINMGQSPPEAGIEEMIEDLDIPQDFSSPAPPPTATPSSQDARFISPSAGEMAEDDPSKKRTLDQAEALDGQALHIAHDAASQFTPERCATLTNLSNMHTIQTGRDGTVAKRRV